MTIDLVSKSRWVSALLQLALLSLALVALFTVADGEINTLDWRELQTQNGERAVEFLLSLFFSVNLGQIGCGFQAPAETAWLVVTLKALSRLIVKIVSIAHLTIVGLNKLILLSDRTRLQDIPIGE